MPRYFFHVIDGKFLVDEDGTDSDCPPLTDHLQRSVCFAESSRGEAGVSQEIEVAIAREQERLARLLEMTKSGKIPAVPAVRETIPDLLTQIREAIDQIEILVGEEAATRV